MLNRLVYLPVAPHYRRTRTAPILNQTPLAFTRILCPMSGRHAKKQPSMYIIEFCPNYAGEEDRELGVIVDFDLPHSDLP